MNEKTSKKTASKAGRILRDKNASSEMKSIAASVLTQAPDKFQDGGTVEITDAVETLRQKLKRSKKFADSTVSMITGVIEKVRDSEPEEIARAIVEMAKK